MSRKIILFLAIIGMLTGLATYLIFFREEPTPVDTFTVEKTAVVRTITSSGTIVSSGETAIRAPLNGTIRKVSAEDGQQVPEGKVLALYDRAPYELAKRQAYATYMAAKLAKQTLERNAPLNEEIQAARALVKQTEEALEEAQETYDDLETDTAKASLNVARTNYKNAQAQLERLLRNYPTETARQKANADLSSAWANFEKAKNDLQRTTVVAPTTGTLLIEEVAATSLMTQGRELEDGVTVTPGQHLFTIIGSNLVFQAEVDEIDIEKISINQDVNLSLDAYEDSAYQGDVRSISSEARVNDEGETVFLVKISFPAETKTDNFKPGLTGDADFILEKIENVIAVPLEAVLAENGQNYVFKIIGGTTKKERIEVGQEIDGEIIIDQGLKEGDRVATTKLSQLKDGDPVRK